MTSWQIKNAIDKYAGIVMKKPISKDMKDHTIEGFAVKEISSGDYDLFVLGQNLSHSIPLLHKRLEEWLKDNNLEY
jgi:hypothetical protein